MQRISDDERRNRFPATPMRPQGCGSATATAALVLLDDASGKPVVGSPCGYRRGVATRAPHGFSTTW